MITKFNEIPTDILNSINWDIEPEEVIAMHLEWGQLRDTSYYIDSTTETVYFVLNTWSKPVIFLNKITGFNNEILGMFDIPEHFIEGIYKYKGAYGLNDNIKLWIHEQIKQEKN